LQWNEVGEAIQKAGSGVATYAGHLLPESKSSYPGGYKILSFYADAETLLSKCYVLRRDSWRDESGLYQRIIEAKKISNMRRYLVEEGRVFVNNVIVTLSPEAKINELKDSGKNVSSAELHDSKPVSIAIPAQFNTIGIVDGQHRIYCYHEGKDDYEPDIRLMRRKQHLLVTGIRYPDGTSDSEKLKFEAKLFLEINSNQTRTRPALTQDIELIVRPFSGVAVARRIVGILAAKGPYKDLFHTSYFDPSYKIKTSSIVSYGLRPLVKFDGDDSLFIHFQASKKQILADVAAKTQEADAAALSLLSEYVEFCAAFLNL
jgi:DGQHR domain-containing protein